MHAISLNTNPENEIATAMNLPCTLLTTALLLLLPLQGMTSEIDKVRLQLIENQRNTLQLRKEMQQNETELKAAQKQQRSDNSPELQSHIEKLHDEITQAKLLIQNLSASVSQQRLDLLTLERGSPPSSLDIALNKALNSNLPELAKKLSHNEAARKEVARLQLLLKEEARVGTPLPATSTSVLLATEQRVAEEEFLRVLALFSGGDADDSEDKVIKITGISNRTPYVEEDILNYLGHQQYHMETTVHTGKMTFTVDGRPWQLSIPKEEDRATYIVIYDISREEKPRMVMFNKTLLLE
jgi:hypothetical protein